MTSTATSAERTAVDPFAAAVVVGLCLCWGLNQVAIKVANAGLQPVFQSGLRCLIGGLLVVGWCKWRRIDLFGRDGTLAAGTVAGLLFGGEFILIYVALDYTTVSRAIVLLYVAPVVVALGAHFLIPGERLTPTHVVGLAAAFGGVALALADRDTLIAGGDIVGDLLCLIAAVSWGATTLVIKTTALRRASAEKVLVYQLAGAAILGLGLSPFFGPLDRGVTPMVVAAFAYQAIIVVAVSYVVWFWMVVRYPATQLAAFTFLTPVFAVALGAILLGETLSVDLLLALALVAVGIFLVNRPRPS